jgi:hypothetical protein
MLPETKTMEKIYTQVQKLSPEERLRLVERIIHSLIVSSPAYSPQPLRFGEFSGDETAMSTLEDFAIAEWHPDDKELNGP